MAGKWFEQFEVGQCFDHEVRRVLSESDNLWFCSVTYNPAPIHIDPAYCATTAFGKPLVNSVLTLGLVIGLSVQDTTFGTTIANVGMSDIKFPKPVFAGDTIRSKTEVKHVRASESKPDAGIVTFIHRGYNQRDELVAYCERQALMCRVPSQ